MWSIIFLTLVGHLATALPTGTNNCHYIDNAVREDYALVECAIVEELDTPRIIGTLHQKALSDALRMSHANLSYRITTTQNADRAYGFFDLNELTGNLIAIRRIDREELEDERICTRDSRATRSSHFAQYMNISCSIKLTAHVIATKFIQAKPSQTNVPARIADSGAKNAHVSTGRSSIQQRRIEIAIRLHILDINDEEPRWANGPFTSITFAENEAPESTRYIESATDRDAGSNGAIRYRLIAPSPANSLPSTRPNSSVNCAQLGIVNGGISHVRIDSITTCQYVTDELRIDTVGGRPFVRLRRALDRESLSANMLVALIEVSDSGSPARSATMTVLVDITDVNDNAPQFDKSSYNVTVSENGTINTLLAIRAHDADRTEPNNAVSYAIVYIEASRPGTLSQPLPNGETSPFIADDHGNLVLTGALDYESATMYTLIMTATDGGSPPRSASTFVHVYVSDVNDNEPRISLVTQSGSLVENSDNKAWFTMVEVTDEDSQSEVACQLANERDSSASFRLSRVDIGSASSRLYRLTARPNATFDRESADYVSVSILCVDGGRLGPSLTTVAQYTFPVTDVNDNPPRFTTSQYHFTVPEGDYSTRPRSIGQLMVSDEDLPEAGALTFSVIGDSAVSDCFRIDDRGEVFARCELDRETKASFQFEAMAVDTTVNEDGSLQRFSATATVSVLVGDLNDCTPQFVVDSSQTHVEFAVDEAASPPFLVGRLRATDCDAPNSPNSELYFSIDTDADSVVGSHEVLPFEVEPNGTIWLRREVDREAVASYSFTVRVSDRGEFNTLFSRLRVSVLVQDANDNPPVFVEPNAASPTDLLFHVRCDASPNYRVTRVRASDLDLMHNGYVRYVLLSSSSADNDSPFALDSATGYVYVARAMSCQSGPSSKRYSLRIGAFDSGVPQLNATIELRISIGGGGGGSDLLVPTRETGVKTDDSLSRFDFPEARTSRQTPLTNRNSNAIANSRRSGNSNNSNNESFYENLNKLILAVIIAVLVIFTLLVAVLCVVIIRRRRIARMQALSATKRRKAAKLGASRDRNNNAGDCEQCEADVEASPNHSEAECDEDGDAASVGCDSMREVDEKESLSLPPNASMQMQAAGCVIRSPFDTARAQGLRQSHPFEFQAQHTRIGERHTHTLNSAYCARSINDSLNGANVHVSGYRPIAFGGSHSQAQKYHFATNTMCESAHLVVSPVPVVPKPLIAAVAPSQSGVPGRSGSATFTHRKQSLTDCI